MASNCRCFLLYSVFASWLMYLRYCGRPRIAWDRLDINESYVVGNAVVIPVWARVARSSSVVILDSLLPPLISLPLLSALRYCPPQPLHFQAELQCTRLSSLHFLARIDTVPSPYVLNCCRVDVYVQFRALYFSMRLTWSVLFELDTPSSWCIENGVNGSHRCKSSNLEHVSTNRLQVNLGCISVDRIKIPKL